MRKIKNTLIVFFVGILTSCGQNPKASIENKKLSNNFLNSAGNISANTKGVIHLDAEYSIMNNELGNTDIYLIHKKGGEWWIEQAKNKYPKMVYPHDWYIDDVYEKAEGNFYNNYNKWVFFIDKKYLEAKLESAEGGEFTSYYPKKNSEIVVILFEQKAGNSEWVAIDSISYKTDKDGNEIKTSDDKGSYYLSSEWQSNFIKEKVKESNK